MGTFSGDIGPLWAKKRKTLVEKPNFSAKSLDSKKIYLSDISMNLGLKRFRKDGVGGCF